MLVLRAVVSVLRNCAKLIAILVRSLRRTLGCLCYWYENVYMYMTSVKKRSGQVKFHNTGQQFRAILLTRMS